MKIAWLLYKRLAEAFPHEFKLAFGDEMMQAGEDSIADLAKRHGIAGVARLIADLALHLPLEYLSEMRRDMKYAVRALAKSPGYALVGVASMGLGIGLTTNVHNQGWVLLTRTLSGVANPNQLVTAETPTSYPYIERYRDQKDLFTGVAAVQNGVEFNVGLPGQSGKPDRVYGQLVSPDYFSVLGMEPQHGRPLSADLDKTGNVPDVVISDRYWRSRFNSDPDIIGQTIRLNGQNATVVGVTPSKFDGALTVNPVELFVPTTVPATVAPELGNDALHNRGLKSFQFLMRLAPGVTIDSAESALDGITRRLDKDDPLAPPQFDKAKRLVLMGAGTRVQIPREIRPKLLGFYIALMAIVTAIACLNLATMALARGTNRRRELAIRLGVGASRFRLIRQMVTEGVLLSLLGGAAGFALAWALAAITAHTRLPAGSPLNPDLPIDWRTALFAFFLAIVSGIGFSVLPALHATKTDIAPALKQGADLQLFGHKRFGLRNVAMSAQVAGSLLLLLVTGFLVLGLVKNSSIQTNFNPKTMAFLFVDPVRDGYTPEKAQAFFERLPDRLRRDPAITSFALAAQPPYLPGDDDNFHLTVDDPHQSSPVQKDFSQRTVGAGFFSVLNQPLVAGREFDERDQRLDRNPTGLPGAAATRLPLVLNQKAARALFGGVRSVVASMDPNLTLFNVQTLSEYLELIRASMSSALRTFGGIGLFGLILSAVGLAGVTAYAVAQRSKEIGIRMALGARKSQVLALVLREGATLVAVGTVIGFLSSVALAKALSAITTAFADAFSLGIRDPRLLIGAPLLLAGLALLACYIPAQRAMAIDPLKALRME